MLRVLIVDDDTLACDITESALSEFDNVEIVGRAGSGKETLEFLKSHQVDLAFLDIEMENMDGFILAGKIHDEFPEVMYVFLTGHVQFALEGYDYQPLSFLTKPISISRLGNIIQQAISKKSETNAGQKVRQVGIHVDGKLELVRTDDVAYMETKGRKVHIICRDLRQLETTESMKKLELIFEEYDFFRIHQSVLINLNLVESIRPDMFKRTYQVGLHGIKEMLPLSRDKKAKLESLLKERGIEII